VVKSANWAKMEPAYQAIIEKYPKLNHVQRVNHLGTLGTGNHFIEVCPDEDENVWFLLHSGSRGVGNRFGTFFIELAKNDMRQWMINLPDKDLAYRLRQSLPSNSCGRRDTSIRLCRRASFLAVSTPAMGSVEGSRSPSCTSTEA